MGKETRCIFNGCGNEVRRDDPFAFFGMFGGICGDCHLEMVSGQDGPGMGVVVR